MDIGNGRVLELLLEDGGREVSIACPPGLLPGPGQYLLAGDGRDAVLPVPLFYAAPAGQGFIAAAPVPDTWRPGLHLQLRGPLGRGFTLPAGARKVGLIVADGPVARLRGLIAPALRQEAAVALVSPTHPDTMPDDVEVHPPSALEEIAGWADYLALDVTREALPALNERLKKLGPAVGLKSVQVLVDTPVPCGGLADCGICAVMLKSGWRLACKDGPVFDWRELIS